MTRWIRRQLLFRRKRVRRVLFALYCVGMLVGISTLYFAVSALLGFLSVTVAAVCGGILYDTSEES